MTEPTGIHDTWASRDRPILVSALRRSDAGERFPSAEAIRQELGFDVDTVEVGMRALAATSPPYIGVGGGQAGGVLCASYVTEIYERTRRELGAWPTAAGLVEQLAAALRSHADAEPAERDKARWRSVADALAGFAREVAIGALAARLG